MPTRDLVHSNPELEEIESKVVSNHFKTFCTISLKDECIMTVDSFLCNSLKTLGWIGS